MRQRLAEQEVRGRAQIVVDETALAVGAELDEVIKHVQAVRTAAVTIESQVGTTDHLARSVVETASATDAVVNAVNESLLRVGGIAKLIAVVAGQTNLLALNATIEAARAGEAGQGFSVVAREVKELAAATGRSTTEISETLATLGSDAAAMAATIQTMTEGIGEIGAATAQLSAVANDQQLTAQRLDRSVGDAIERIQAMATVTERLDRRGSTRVAANGRVRLDAGGVTHELSLLDLSEGGMRCIIGRDVPLAVGSRAQLHLEAGSVSESIGARVVRRVPGPEGDDVGLEFVEISTRGRAQVADYVRSILVNEDEPAE